MSDRRDRRQRLVYEVVRLSHEGHSQRAIGRALGIARLTVQRVLAEQAQRREKGESAIARAAPAQRLPKGSKLDDHEARLRGWLKQYPELTAVRCLEMLAELGFQGRYTIVRERLRELKNEVAPKPPAVVVKTAIGQRAEFDWSPYTLANALEIDTWNATLCWSRGGYLAGARNTKQSTILAMLAASFEDWQGVPRECLTDSMPGVVDRWECEQPVLNARFVDFAAYYGFTVLIAPRGCPQFKARCERRFRYHEDNLLGGRTITSFEQYTELLDWWRRERMLARPHPETKRPIREMLEEERKFLLRLPAKAYDSRDVLVRIINPTGHVRVESNQYPVPAPARVGDRVYVCVGGEGIEICDRRAVRLIEHERLPDGAGIQLPQLASVRHRGRYDVDALVERIAEWGESAAEFARQVKKTRRYPGPQLVRLLDLQAEWSLDDIVAAMEHAAQYRCHDAAAVARILTARFSPRRFEEAIAESTRRQIRKVMEAHPIRQRSLTSYESLCQGDRHPSAEDGPGKQAAPGGTTDEAHRG